jgi:CBS domain-containing protein
LRDSLTAVLNQKGDKVHNVTPECSVLEAVQKMNQEHVGALLVCSEGKLVGIFTERDVLIRVVDSGCDPSATRVAEVMTRELVVVKPSTTVEEAMAVVTEKRCRHLPVVEEGELRGVVSIGDLTRWVTRNQQVQIQDLVNYITGKYPA